MSKPWSPAEVEQAIPVLIDRMEDALTDLKGLGIRSAQLKWEFEGASSHARLYVEGSNAEDRKASLYRYQFEDGSTLIDKGMAMDMSANAYADARTELRAIDAELAVARTLLVSARDYGPGAQR